MSPLPYLGNEPGFREVSVPSVTMTNPLVNSYVTVREGCSMRFTVVDSRIVEFAFGGLRDPFELFFDVDSLRDFLALAATAQQEMAGRGLPVEVERLGDL